MNATPLDKTFLSAEWRWLAMLNWEIDPAVLDRLVPAGTELDLGARAWEELVLAQPSKLLCRENCNGLCSTCGKNLNKGPCDCRTVEAEDTEESAPTRKSLAGLGELFPDLKSGATED